MSFKIVNTIKKGQFVSTIIPEAWEHEGVVRWPLYDLEKLKRLRKSVPEDNWLRENCMVKSQNLSYEEAECVLRVMNEVTGTATYSRQNEGVDHTYNDLECLESLTQTNKHVGNTSRIGNEVREFLVLPAEGNINRSEILQEDQIHAYKYRKSASETEAEVIAHRIEMKIEQQDESSLDSIPDNEDPLTTYNKDIRINRKLKRLESKLDAFIDNTNENQRIIEKNQKLILSKLANISAQFEGFVNGTPTSTTSSAGATDWETPSLETEVISDEQGLNDFEDSLKDKQTADKIAKTYSVICEKGKGRAINNAYALIDAMFDRRFLNQCSWAGGSRVGESKICFKNFKRTINLFFQIIHASDDQFTVMECEDFLKNILRHAKTRSESRQLKRSCRKIRLRHGEPERSFAESLRQNINEKINTIDSEESLVEFEQSLRDDDFVKKMTRAYSTICGEGKGGAITNAYALVDVMFTRKFLNLCSWAGGSRGETSKICLKSFKRTLDFFFKIIYTSDNQFTMMECETFFKNILRNSRKRFLSKNMRKSTQKRRQRCKNIDAETSSNNVDIMWVVTQ